MLIWMCTIESDISPNSATLLIYKISLIVAVGRYLPCLNFSQNCGLVRRHSQADALVPLLCFPSLHRLIDNSQTNSVFSTVRSEACSLSIAGMTTRDIDRAGCVTAKWRERMADGIDRAGRRAGTNGAGAAAGPRTSSLQHLKTSASKACRDSGRHGRGVAGAGSHRT